MDLVAASLSRLTSRNTRGSAPRSGPPGLHDLLVDFPEDLVEFHGERSRYLPQPGSLLRGEFEFAAEFRFRQRAKQGKPM